MTKILWGLALLFLVWDFAPENGETVYVITYEGILGVMGYTEFTVNKTATRQSVAEALCVKKYENEFLKRLGYDCT